MVSGRLGRSVLEKIGASKYQLVAVMTDRKSTLIIDYCEENAIPLFVGNPRKGRAATFIQDLRCDVLLSVNYLFIIEEDLIRLPRQYAINIHGSLLPLYRGRSPHVWAIINGEKETGITAHLIEGGVDTGRIVKQMRIPIGFEDTGGAILEKFNALYPSFIFLVLEDVANGCLQLATQDHNKAVFFGKRTPEDGRIQWSWSRERIRNWIRAQADPYPGAFTFFKEKKIIIHQANYDDTGFHYDQPNGTILQLGEQEMIVKTPNGALRLEGLQVDEWPFEVGAQLN